MPENPLVFFGPPQLFTRPTGTFRPVPIQVSDRDAHAERITPQFQRLGEALEAHRVALLGNPQGIVPEQTLVIEIAGSIDNFIDTVRRTEGLDWLGEFELDPIGPDLNLSIKDEPAQLLPRRLYLVTTDQLAQNHILNLFRRYKNNPQYPLDRGYGDFKKLFDQLIEIRHWNHEDRIDSTHILEDWQDRLNQGQEHIPFETEFWFRDNAVVRANQQAELVDILERGGGEVVQSCVVPEIGYHGLLANAPARTIQQIVDEPGMRADVRMLQCQGIRHIRPVGQCGFSFLESVDEVTTSDPVDEAKPTKREPWIALLDGMPLVEHEWIRHHVVLDDPDDLQAEYQANERRHGTFMTSLISRGDFEVQTTALDRPIYVRPVLKPVRFGSNVIHELVPDDVLFTDLIHRSIRRLFDGDGDEDAVASSVKIVNLSICDPNRQFFNEVSPLARLLDWLAHKYNVLFIVSAGNINHNIEMDVGLGELQNFSSIEYEKKVMEAIALDQRNRRLLSPAETINGITVGATHDDASSSANTNFADPFTGKGFPSVISAQGPGYRRSVKPDISLPGGRQFVAEQLGNGTSRAVLRIPETYRPPGHLVASPGEPGQINAKCHVRGTSNSAALASRNGSAILEMMEELRRAESIEIPSEYDTVLMKTLLVHSADWSSVGEKYHSLFYEKWGKKRCREYVGQLIGYGSIDINRVLRCTDQRITMLGYGKIAAEEMNRFELPLPQSLELSSVDRRITVTLSWLSPIKSTRREYRVAQLWFEPPRGVELATKRMYAEYNAVRRGTIQHEVFKGQEAVPYQIGESLDIDVNCRADADEIREPIRYGLAVTLEVAEDIDVPIYQEVQSQLTATSLVRVDTGVQVRQRP